MDSTSAHNEEFRELWKWQGSVSVLLEYAADLLEGKETYVTAEYAAERIREALSEVH